MKCSFLLGLCAAFFLLIESSNGQLLTAKSVATKTLPFQKTVEQGRKSGGNRNDPSLPWRIPQNIKPCHYELNLIPILDEDVEGLGERWTVPGSVKINLVAHESTNKIILHAHDMELITNNFTLHKVEDNSIVEIVNIEHNEATMLLTLELSQDLEINVPYLLGIMFISKIREEFHGMYRSTYEDPVTNTIKWIAITQMEALHARELFPCFDEPGFKAVFSTKIGRKESYTALTNGHSIKNESIPDFPGWIWETFADTPLMSTYLLAIVISDYDYTEASGSTLPIVRTYAPSHQIQRHGGVYSSEKGALLLNDFATRFGQEYPMDKMDLASVNDFTFGAMENFGLNIYQEQLLLLFPDESTEAERERLTQVLAHELAHQWFGNKVSPAWWTHIWLNEGISTYIQFLGLNVVAPEFMGWDLFLGQTLQRALAYDAIVGVTHPLKIEEEQWIEEDAMWWFDLISYQKGGSITRMMEGFLTPSMFQQGLRTYQENKKFQSAVQDDLFDALDQHAENKLPVGMNFSQVMEGWTKQSGFPYLTVAIDGEKIGVTQTKYKGGTNLWVIPISVASRDNPNFGVEPEYWLSERMMTLNETAGQWVILNAGSTGYYRVLYDEPIEKLILEQLLKNHTAIHSHSRSQIIDDYFNFVWDSEASVIIQRALGFTKYMSTQVETEMVVWTPLFKHLEHYLNTFGSAGAGMFEDMKTYLLPRIKSTITASGGFNKLNLNSKGMDVLSHTQLLDWACALEDNDCINFAAGSVDAWKENIKNNPINHDLKPVLYCAAARKDKSYGEFLIAEYKNMTNELSHKQRQLLLSSFQCIGDVSTIDMILGETLGENLFHNKIDASMFLQSLASNYKLRDHLVSFIAEKTEEIITWFGPDNGKSVLTSVVASMSNFMSTSEELIQVQEYATQNEEIFQGGLNIYIAKIENNIDLIEKFGKPMQQYFKDNSNVADNGFSAITYVSYTTITISFLVRFLINY